MCSDYYPGCEPDDSNAKEKEDMSHFGEQNRAMLQRLGNEISAARRTAANYNELKQICGEVLEVWTAARAFPPPQMAKWNGWTLFYGGSKLR